VLANAKLLGALFAADSVKARRNTDAVEVAPNVLVAARVLEHQPAAQRKLEEVKGEISEMLRNREASALALKDGTAKLEQLRKGQEAGVKWGAPRMISRRESQGLQPNVMRQVFGADTAKLPAYVGIPIPDAGYVLLRVSRVIDEPAKEADPQTAMRAASLYGNAQYQAFVESLRSRADIEVRTGSLTEKK
jgi:peptidyl-prolyl cis-trans isomerase D